jgi:nucleotide-binding universal stress UspA family protein
MYRRIVLAYDGTKEGRTALREGALVALRSNAQIFLLAIQTGVAGIGIADSLQAGPLPQRQLEDFKTILEEGVVGLKSLGVEPVAKLVSGEPAIEIRNFAREVGADLVVVGHRRQSLLDRWWSGSSGAYILDNIDCSLLVARRLISNEEFAAELERIGLSKH